MDFEQDLSTNSVIQKVEKAAEAVGKKKGKWWGL